MIHDLVVGIVSMFLVAWFLHFLNLLKAERREQKKREQMRGE